MRYTPCNFELEHEIKQNDALFSFSALHYLFLKPQKSPDFTIEGKQRKVDLIAEDTSDTKVLRAS